MKKVGNKEWKILKNIESKLWLLLKIKRKFSNSYTVSFDDGTETTAVRVKEGEAVTEAINLIAKFKEIEIIPNIGAKLYGFSDYSPDDFIGCSRRWSIHL